VTIDEESGALKFRYESKSESAVKPEVVTPS
jgi:hypothetical protein